MKLVRYKQRGQVSWGVLDGDVVCELEGDPWTPSSRPGRASGRLEELCLLAPCSPATIWSNGSNYPSRCRERNAPLPTEPSFLWCPGTIVCGSGAQIRIPGWEERSEYGAELGIVIADDCYRVADDEAERYILGYTALNNVWSKDPPGVLRADSLRVYETYCPVGPILATGFDAHDRTIRLTVDGALRQDDRTSSMLFSPPRLVSALSHLVPIRRGDLIMSGTPGGIEGQVLHPGEEIDVEIEGLGRLRNRVARVDTAVATAIRSVPSWLREAAGRDYLRATLGNRDGGE